MEGVGRNGRGLLVGPARREELLHQSVGLPSIVLTPRQLADLELLLNGAFAPLSGFMVREEYFSVCCEMRLPDETLWPMPITLRVAEELALGLGNSVLALREASGELLAVLHVEDVWQPDLLAEAAAVFGTVREEHPGVTMLLQESKFGSTWNVGGRVEGLQLPVHYDYRDLRKTPDEMRVLFQARGWERVVAFQTRNPLHRFHVEATLRAAEQVDARLLIHPAVGPTKPGDLDPMTRVRCYRAAMRHYPSGGAELAVLPLAMRMAGPREALWHALIRKNFGCTHLILGRDHAGPGRDQQGEAFYPPFAAQQLVQEHADEIGIEVVALGEATGVVPGTEVRRRLVTGEALPAGFTFPEVESVLRQQHEQGSGCTVFLTGLSGAGKSTVAGILASRLGERGLPVTLLDGDHVRQHLSSELTFSREHRDLNICRIGYVAAEVTRHGGIAICAPIAPYDEVRKEVRRMVQEHGHFVLVHVDTPLFVCEARDPKGLYKKARAGTLPNFTGVSDPYEEPTDADVVLDTMVSVPEESAELLFEHLVEMGIVPEQAAAGDVVIPASAPQTEPATDAPSGTPSAPAHSGSWPTSSGRADP